MVLSIYNIKGQKVKTLLNELKEKGVHQITWNGTDENDSQVSSGVYFYRLQTGQFITNRRILLIK